MDKKDINLNKEEINKENDYGEKDENRIQVINNNII